MSTGTTTPPLLTAAEFAARPEPIDGSQEELVKGVVVTMPPPSFIHGIVQTNLAFLLRLYTNTTNIGQVTTESGLLTDAGPDTVRGPDVAFWSYDRVPADHEPAVYANVAADLVAEVVSPSNTRKQVAAKVREYFASGVRTVWVIDPDERSATVFAKPGEGTVLWEDGTLTAPDVLPGFGCRIADLFTRGPIPRRNA